MAIQARLRVANQKLIAAIGLMESTADEPRDVQQIAADVGLSPRQLERLFAKYLHASPSHHYLELRLDRARELLLQTTKPILDVAVACGNGGSHARRGDLVCRLPDAEADLRDGLAVIEGDCRLSAQYLSPNESE